ncbi:MAG: sigma-70 family RNA polymerase sigma factor [Planctomycetota bacterium]
MSDGPTNNDPDAAEPEAVLPKTQPPDDDASAEDDRLSSAALSAAIPFPAAVGAALGEGADSSSTISKAEPTTNPERLRDDRLIDRALSGDSTAYGELVGLYQDRLRGSLMRLTGSAEEAEDVAQEAFVQAYLKLSSFQRSSRFYTWIYRIAFNQAISKNRKKRPRVSLTAVQDAGGPEPVAEALGPLEPTLQGERSELLHAAIAELEDDHRQVIVLREFEDMDYQQIADLIGAPIGTVRSRLFRARSQLRERLAEALGDE